MIKWAIAKLITSNSMLPGGGLGGGGAGVELCVG